MRSNQIRKGLIFFIIGLFFVSSFSSIVFGNNTASLESSETSDLNVQLENLAFYCMTPNGLNEQKYNHYEKRLLSYYLSENSNDNTTIGVKKEKVNIQIETSIKTLTIGTMNSAWPMKCHDISHTSRSPYSTASNPGIEKWRFRCEHMDAGIVIDDEGTIYFGVKNRYLYAVFSDGTLKWRFHVDNWISSTPAIDEDGTIYIGSWDGGLYAINPDGTQKWRFGSGATVASSPVIADDGTIYFGCMGPEEYGRIYAVNPNGTEKWHYDADWYIVSDPAIGNDGTVYIGSLDSYLYALYPNGTLRWRFKTGDRIYGSPSIADDGTIFIGSSWDSYLYALYPNGTLKWKYGGAGTPNNPSIGVDGTIYAGYLYNLVALHPDGSLKWSFYVGDNRWIGKSAPAISVDGTIYFGTNIGDAEGGEIIAVNPDGTERWRKVISEEWVDSSPAIAEDGTIYIGSLSVFGGYLHAFGSQESNNPPGDPVISGPPSGNAGTEYLYNFISVDPDNNPVSFYIDWGDGSTPSWSREYASGETAKIHHTWSEQGSYTIQVKARDTFNGESDWATFDVTMPRSRIFSIDFFLQFLQNRPNLFPLVRFLLKL